MKYASATEIAGRWGLSRRRIITLCHDGRIEGAQKAGATWIIPEDAKKPADARIKSGKYTNIKTLANNVPFDDRVNHEAEISDLNITLIRSYLKEVRSSLYDVSKTMDFLELCRNMNLLSTLPEYAKPKNVALMFFCLEPDKFFPYTQIDVVQFPEGTGGDKIIEATFKGPIHQQLREALQYIRNSVIVEQVIKHPDRAEADRFFNYPYVAIEEALANAVYHRAYDVREPIEVRVEPDRLEILSFPGPDRSVTMEGLKNYRVTNRRYRNRRIGDFLRELHLTEGRNTGFKKILTALENNGSPKPEFETDDDRTYFISRFYPHPGFEVGNVGYFVSDVGNSAGNVGNVGNARNPAGDVGKLAGNELRIYREIKANPSVSAAAIAEAVSLSKRTVERISGRLREKGYIIRDGSTRGKWIVLK